MLIAATAAGFLSFLLLLPTFLSLTTSPMKNTQLHQTTNPTLIGAIVLVPLLPILLFIVCLVSLLWLPTAFKAILLLGLAAVFMMTMMHCASLFISYVLNVITPASSPTRGSRRPSIARRSLGARSHRREEADRTEDTRGRDTEPKRTFAAAQLHRSPSLYSGLSLLGLPAPLMLDSPPTPVGSVRPFREIRPLRLEAAGSSDRECCLMCRLQETSGESVGSREDEGYEISMGRAAKEEEKEGDPDFEHYWRSKTSSKGRKRGSTRVRLETIEEE